MLAFLDTNSVLVPSMLRAPHSHVSDRHCPSGRRRSDSLIEIWSGLWLELKAVLVLRLKQAPYAP